MCRATKSISGRKYKRRHRRVQNIGLRRFVNILRSETVFVGKNTAEKIGKKNPRFIERRELLLSLLCFIFFFG